ASWLIPAALILGGVAFVAVSRRHRVDRTRAALIISLGWLVATALVFSLGKGIIHEYYAVALAPAIGGKIAVRSGLPPPRLVTARGRGSRSPQQPRSPRRGRWCCWTARRAGSPTYCR